VSQPPERETVPDSARHVVLTKPGDLLLIGNVGRTPREQIQRMSEFFAQLGIRVAFFAGDIDTAVQPEAPAPDGRCPVHGDRTEPDPGDANLRPVLGTTEWMDRHEACCSQGVPAQRRKKAEAAPRSLTE